ncbi:MAG: thiamine phosphate synthase [Pyrinomonadaceae bacterium]
MNFELPLIYPITDVRISGVSHFEQVERLIAGGATLIQLREKHASPREFYESAAEVIVIAKRRGVRIIINDRVDIALTLKADGVHLGQDDMPPELAKTILGENAIIGFSTHALEQAKRAIRLPIDYIAFGPIFPTKTKDTPDYVVGLKGLSDVRKVVGNLPLVAIGGINATNLSSVFEAGADSAAMISALVSDPAKIEDRMKKLIQLIEHKR